MMSRHDGRAADQLRLVTIDRGFPTAAVGSVLIQAGRTRVLCTASVDESVPPWMEGRGTGWVTAEYSMLPGSTAPRKRRERTKVDGRTTEIQRLIGRSLRAAVDMAAFGERSILIDCDVLQADGGTRTASITGAFVALCDAIASLRASDHPPSGAVLRDSVAAVSVGIIDGEPALDLDYVEDSGADVDMNLVTTGDGKLIEIQGTAERGTFDQDQLAAMLALGRAGIVELTRLQRAALGSDWPFPEISASAG